MKKTLTNPLTIFILTFVIVLLLGTVLKNNGFHFQNFKLVRGGDLVVASSGIPTTILIDTNKISGGDGVTEDITLIENVQPGKRTLLVFNDLYWPWKKDIQIESKETVTVSPFLINKNPSGLIVSSQDSEYPTLLHAINTNPVPTKEKPKNSKSGQVRTWVEGGSTIMAGWNGSKETAPDFFCNDEGVCETEVVVLEAENLVRGADFFTSRDDVLIIAFSNGVFAIEIDKRGNTQNFQPIYKGTDAPRFIVVDERTIHIVDGSAIFIITI